MGKTAQIKGDLDDLEAILEIINILKDVSTNRFFTFAQQKEDFSKFLEIFLTFFNMLESLETDCPLVRNDYEGTDIVVITSESSFMAQLNSKVCGAASREIAKYPDANVICVGYRGVEKLKQMGIRIERAYTDIEKQGFYKVALNIRDYLIERVMCGQAGKCMCIYIWTKSFNVLKPRLVKLLPAEELMGSSQASEIIEENAPAASPDGQPVEVEEHRSKTSFINESTIDGIMKVLADIWCSCRLFEMISDNRLSEAAAQAQQLESAMEGLSAEKKGMMLSFKKASRGDLNKAMREVFTSSKVCRGRRH